MSTTHLARQTRRFAILALVAFAASGCLMHEKALQSPFRDPALSTSSFVENPVLLVATTRKPEGDGKVAPFFSSTRGAGLTFAEARVNPPDNAYSRKLDRSKADWAVLGLENRTAAGASDALARAANGKDVLIYVHGYNETFDTAALGAATLADGVGFEGRTALFAWPSGGRLINYAYDRESALWSRDAFEEVLAKLAGNPTVGRIHIVAHSMGAFLTLETLRQLRSEKGEEAARRIGAVVLASPDIDIDQFETAVKRLGPLAQRMTVISASNDRALNVSATLAGGVARAGAADRSRLESLGVRVADASDFGGSFRVIRHDLFLTDDDVRAVIKRAIERSR